MDVTKTKIDKFGNQYKEKVEMPSIGQIVTAVNERKMYNAINRISYGYSVEDALKVIEAIGKSRDPKFVIDDANRFCYVNFIKWCHSDESMQALHPQTGEVIPGRLNRGIYIAGRSGTGKSWCLEIMLAYAQALQLKIQFMSNDNPTPLYWRTLTASEYCEYFAENGNYQEFKRQPILGIQDMGQEPQETLYMGNRHDVIKQIIEYRGDIPDEITMITSNLKMSGEKLNKRYGDKVQSRLYQMCNYFEILGVDRRLMY